MKISFRPMRVGLNTKWSVPLLAVGLSLMLAPSSQATLLGLLNLPPSGITLPGVATGDVPGTLLADMVAPYSFKTTAGTTSGTLESAVYQESGGGTLDFYYQVASCGSTVTKYCTGAPSATGIARETNTSFTGFMTDVGFRTDGGSYPLTGTTFVDGTLLKDPLSVDRDSTGAVVGFLFAVQDAQKIHAGETSSVIIIATDATMFTMGNASVIDGGTQTVAAYQPGSVPEPGSMVLIGGGLLALAGIRRFRS